MNRLSSIDVLRGLIMIIMALDHAIGVFAVHPPPEVALDWFQFPGYSSPAQQWSRLVTHVCAPGFQLLAGMGLALSVMRSQQRGFAETRITIDLVARGCVLLLLDWFVMSFTIYQSPMLFLVLCCIGASTLCMAVLRFLPKYLIGLVGLGIIAAAPLYCPTVIQKPGASTYFFHIWTEIALGQGPGQNWFNILYPVLPWLGCFVLGWWIGLQLGVTCDETAVKRQGRVLLMAGVGLFVVGFALRWSGLSFAERIPLSGATPLDAAFWQFAKYPPTVVFLLLTLGVLLAGLGILRQLDLRASVPAWGQFVSVYGRTALFYFVVHFYALGIAGVVLGVPPGDLKAARFTFGQTYLVWIAVVLLLWPVCWGYDKLRQRYRTVLRYF